MHVRTLLTALHAVAAAKTPERLPPAARAREALKLVDAFDCDSSTRRRAAYYALHPEAFWGDAHCEKVLDVVAAHAAPGLGLDIGANVGATLDYVRRCAGGTKCAGVVAFEPNPANLALLKAAAGADVTIVEKAASHIAGQTVAFNPPTGTDQAGQYFDGDTPGNPFGGISDGEGSFDVVTTTVDAEVEGHVSFAKIDVEGHESAVLRGMETTLQRTDCLLVECSDLATHSKTPVLEMADFFDERGFDTYRVGSSCLLPLWGRHYHTLYDEWRYWSNVVAVRRDCGGLAEALQALADVAGLDGDLEEALRMGD